MIEERPTDKLPFCYQKEVRMYDAYHLEEETFRQKVQLCSLLEQAGV
jgi:hypothetical protein